MDLINLPMDLLRSFLTITEFGGFTKAGEVLGRTQPAMSLQMQRLETLVGAKLFQKKGRQLILTEQGERLAHYSRQILHLNDTAISDLSAVAVKSAVNVGFPASFHVPLSDSCIIDFVRNAAARDLSLHCDLGVSLLERLSAGALDVVIAVADEQYSGYLQHEWRVKLAWIGVPGWHLKSDEAVPLVCGPEGCEVRSIAVELLNAARVPWRIAVSSPDIGALAHAVASGVGVTLLPVCSLFEGTVPLVAAETVLPAAADIAIGAYCNPRGGSEAVRTLTDQLVDELDLALKGFHPNS